MVRLLLVDDHPVVLAGLEAALAAYGEVEVVGQAASLNAAREALATTAVDVALVDIRLPDGTGFELIEWSGELDRPPAFVMLTTFVAPQYLSAGIRLGARGYLLKTAPIDEIVDAVRRVAAGGVAFLTDGGEAFASPPPALTRREQQIIAKLLQGHMNKEISAELGLSQKTVEWHLGKLFLRLGVHSRTELAATAQREGWLGSVHDGRPLS